MSLKILDVGSGPNSVVEMVFPDKEKEITRLDIDPLNNPDIIHDITQPFPEEMLGQFDIVYASHVIEHLHREDVIPTIQNLTACLVELGELWIVVPSAEWAAERIYRGYPDLSVQAIFHGGQRNPYDFHYCSFTLVELRRLFHLVGLIPRRLFQSEFTIQFKSGADATALQNIAIGAKYVGDPATAID